MPTFFRKDTLTKAQLDNWDYAIKQYNKIYENNLLEQYNRMTIKDKKKILDKEYDINLEENKDELIKILTKKFIYLAQPGDEKSALFFRLLNGKRALIKPPPLSFSYPCYEFIEQLEPIEIGTLNTKGSVYSLINKHTDYINYNYILIDQGAWKVLEVKSENSMLITHQNWEDLGFLWNLSLKEIELAKSSTRLIAHHDSNLYRITKYDELLKEVDYHTDTYFKKILISLNEDRFQSYKNDLMKKYDKIGSMMSEQDKLQSEQYIQKKLEQKLPIEPTELEIDNYRKMILNNYLNDSIFNKDGVLYIKTWVLTRLQPKTLNENIYI